MRLGAVGVLGGFVAGVFGVGGGIIMVPLLVLVARMDQRRASATSLLAIIPTAIAGALTWAVSGHVNLLVALVTALGGVLGGWIGARLLHRLPLSALRWAFLVLLVLVAVRLAMVAPTRGAEVTLAPGLLLGLAALGILTGITSGLFGVGGGVVMVPMFIAGFGMSDLLAKGTSLAVMIPTAVSGSVANLRRGTTSLREGLVVGLPATITAILGAWCATLLSAMVANWLFVGLMAVGIGQLTVRAIRADWAARRARRGDTQN